MATKFQKLFEPIKIGEVEIKNRIAMAPMGILGLLNPDGSVGPRGMDYFLERAKGGIGLIITGLFKVENEIESLSGIPLISSAAIASFAELSEAVHALGSKIFVQLTAGLGRVAIPSVLRTHLVSASAIPSYWDPSKTCRELETEEVEQIIKCFGNAAEILAAAEIDGVELHGHEGYLFDQFATLLWNRRTDKYGGNLEARLRFPIEVLHEIKGRVGQSFSVQYRFGLKHYIKDLRSGALADEKFLEAGRDIEEGLQMAKILEDAGFDAFHVDAGCYDSWYWAHPPVYQKNGCMVDMAARVKKVVKIPVISVGKLGIPELAEQVIAEGKADIVAIGKSLLADPFWAKKVEEGRPEQIRPCIGCHDGCMGRITKAKPLSCAVNPATGRERTYKIERAEKFRNIMIIGGGVAGLEAARVAAFRGHRVTLYEKTNSLGGHLNAASVPSFKKDLARLLDWYQVELKKLDLEIKLNFEVKPDLVEREKPDVLIIATGSKPTLPNIPGLEKSTVTTAIDLLLGKKKAGEKVFVLGGGLIGCETALWLAQQGKKVIIGEILHDVMIAGIPVQHMNRMMLMNLLKFHNVDMIMNTSLLEVTERGVLMIDKAFCKRNLEVDTVVTATGLSPDQKLYRSVRGTTPNLFLIGDSRRAQNVMGSIWDAYEVARNV
ncbi:MAG: FAD-dependent oxidoreductase [Thermodesulfobacteriota bacterium]